MKQVHIEEGQGEVDLIGPVGRAGDGLAPV